MTEERLHQQYPGETLVSIYDGIPQSLDPRTVCEPSLPSTSSKYEKNAGSILSQTACHLTGANIHASNSQRTTSKSDSVRNKRKNYKGQSINTNVKVRIVRPQIVDTSTIVKRDTSNKNVFSSQKKVQNNITIKLIPRNDNEKKRIVIKNPRYSAYLILC